MNDPKIIVALDYSQPRDALQFAKQVDPSLCRLKVGKELFTSSGPQLVEQLMGLGFEIFLDLKFHDIPNTVAAACKAAASIGVWMVNVHAMGGSRMLAAAREAVSDTRTRLIAVTVLTSMGREDLSELGFAGDPFETVMRLARLAHAAGLDGVVCSAQEASRLKAEFGQSFWLVTPGIRPANSAQGDQKRVMTPREAILAGSDYLVIGRPIRDAADPVAMLRSINRELTELA